MEKPLVNISQNGEVEVKGQNFGCFFTWRTEYVKETDFVQLIISLLNKMGNPL